MWASKYKDKISETMKIHSFLVVNRSISGNESQLEQAIGQTNKNFCPNRENQQDQFSNTLATGSNLTTVRKNGK